MNEAAVYCVQSFQKLVLYLENNNHLVEINANGNNYTHIATDKIVLHKKIFVLGIYKTAVESFFK